MKADSDKLRVGIVSANWGAIAHLPAWRSVPGVEVTAMCTSRRETAEKAAAQFNIERPFWSVETMCADPDIDIVDVGTGPVQRETMVATALAYGKHVMNQMPFAASLAGAQKLVALQRAAGVKGGAAASVVGMPHVELMREMIAEGFVGEVFQVHCSWQMSFFLDIYPGFSYTWFGKAGNGTSVTRNQGTHMLHLLRHLFGPIRSVMGRMEIKHPVWTLPEGETMANETDDTLHALIDFAGGAMGTLQTSWVAADMPGFYLDVFGSKGRLRLEALRYPSVDTAKLYAAKAKIGFQPRGEPIEVPERLYLVGGQALAPDPLDGHSGGQRIALARLFNGLASSIRGEDADFPVTFDRSLEIQSIIEALYQSHAARAWVDIPQAN